MKRPNINHWMIFAILVPLLGCAERPEAPSSGIDTAISGACVVFPHPNGWADPSSHGNCVVNNKSAEPCLKCHQQSSDKTEIPATCASCHPLYPHETDWVQKENHGQYVLDNGKGNCATQCHGVDLQGGLSGVSCNACHTVYPHNNWNHGEAALAQISVCKSCHGVGLDEAPAGYQSCNDCHPTYLPHNSAALGGPDWGDGQVHGILGANSTPCQLCHGADLNGGVSGVSCNACHSGTEACLGCHGRAQDNGDGIPLGGRRAVVSEFPSGVEGQHAHHSVSLSGPDCLICHSQTTHTNGKVDLIDPDNGNLYSFVLTQDLASDPDISDFCLHCHDADGATRLADPMNPFGNGNAPPDVASRFKGTLQWKEWYGDSCFGSEGTLREVNSHHDISDSDQAFSDAKIECLNCHGSHRVSAAKPLVDPLSPSQGWTGMMNDFCLKCHGGGTPTDPGMPSDVDWPSLDSDPTSSSLRGIDSCNYTGPPWYVDVSWTHSAHGLDSKRGWTGYSGRAGAVIDCTVCHDPHGSYDAVTNPVGNPYMIRDVVDGTPFVDDGVLGDPEDLWGVSRPVIVTVTLGANPPPGGTDPATVDWGGSTGLCSTCHANWPDAMWAHGFCTACQSCHNHGGAWGEEDWVDSNDTQWCP